ncbi:CAP domain-containing protein [Myxococcus sp. CA051A]|nr:CAP domain-containing protein [Myxococcus sp. CA051A]
MNSCNRALVVLLFSGLPGIAWAAAACVFEGRETVCGSTTPSICLKPDSSKSIKALIASEWAKEWVEAHNRVRASVVDAKPPLPKVVWSDELAQAARGWASQCKFAHDTCRVTPGFLSYVGQNLYMSASSDPNSKATTALVSQAVNGWGNERRFFPQSSINPFVFDAAYGHYTQLVWRKTTAIGCAVASCSSASQPLAVSHIMVCNYGPGGNMVGAKAY